MNIDFELLKIIHRDKKVLIPGFGVLKLVHVPAEIHPVKHTFTPPFARIIFELDVDSQDNSLKAHFVNEKNTTLEEVENHIKAYVQSINEDINNSGKRVFESVGTLTKNADGNFIFVVFEGVVLEPDYNALPEFVSLAVKRTRKQQNPTQKATVKIKKSVVLLFAVVLIIVSAVAAYFIFPEYVNNNMKALSSKFFNKEKIELAENIKDVSEKETPKKMTVDKEMSGIKEPSDEKQSTTSEVEIPQSDMHTDGRQEVAPTHKKYYIVAGSFKNKNNAETFVQELKQKNYPDAQLLTPKKSSFYTVVYAGFTEKSVAESELVRINNIEKSGSWIIHE